MFGNSAWSEAGEIAEINAPLEFERNVAGAS